MSNIPDWIGVHKNVLTKNECKSIIKFCNGKMYNHKLNSNLTDASSNGYRTSNQYWIELNETIDKKIRKFTSEITKQPINHQERTSVIKYENGQEYKSHYDCWYYSKNTSKYNRYITLPGNTDRVMTCIFYLNEGYEGGETGFPLLDLAVKAETGMCISYVNMFDENTPNKESLHCGLPVIKGVKYIATKWVHFTPFKVIKRKHFLNRINFNKNK